MLFTGQIICMFFVLRYVLARGSTCNTTRNNLCTDAANYCLNAGTCYYDKTTCHYSCRCAPLYMGRRCGERAILTHHSIVPGASPGDIATSPSGRAKSPSERDKSPSDRVTSPSGTAKSPSDRATSPSRTAKSSSGTGTAPSDRAMSPSDITTSPSGTATSPSGTTTSPSDITTSPSGTTTSPSNTPTSPSDRATSPSGTTTSPSNTPTSPSDRATSPRGTTTSPRDITTSPSDTPTSPSGTTTSPSDRAISPRGTTTSPRGTTTSPSDITTSPSGTTTSPSNTPTSPSDRATLPSGTVTSPSVTTTSPSATSPSDTPTSSTGTATSPTDTAIHTKLPARFSRSASNPTSVHVCSANYTMRPQSERNCKINGIKCIYGVCDKLSNTIECICDAGGTGPLCRDKCCLQCSEYGTCEKYANGTDWCHCETNYEGRYCDIRTSFTSPEVETATSPSWDTVSLFSGTANRPNGTTKSSSYTDTSPTEITMSHNDTATSPSGTATSPSGTTTSPSGTTTSPSDSATSPSGTATSPSDIATSPIGTATSPSGVSNNTRLPTPDSGSAIKPNETVHVCSANYTLRPLSERDCKMNNYVCKYGFCNKISKTIDCICDAGGTGPLCRDKCCLQCSEYGTCEKYANGTDWCHCQTNYEGRLCDILPIATTPVPNPEPLTMWWLSVAVLVCVIGAAMILFFWMWRKRVTIIMKIVHYFQPYEDDDEKTWDAFISYKSADDDQNFVLRELLPNLEKLGFTVCLHFRDFIPGETIANNIINAIKKSRRTILILTPRYVSSEFTRLEYQVAQHEMLKLKHKIVPVLLEDISEVNDTMDANLKHILKTVTYLEYPGADSSEKNMKRFWKDLSLAMPKKRPTDVEQKQQNDIIVDVIDEQHLEEQINDVIEKNEGAHALEVTHF